MCEWFSNKAIFNRYCIQEEILQWRWGSKLAAHGTISEFSNTQETWYSYIECLEQYLAANKVETSKRAILLSVFGPATYRLIHNLVSPKKPTELKFQDLVTKHHDPRPSVIVQRYRFNTRNRRGGESIPTYVAEFRHLSEHCNFGTSLNEMLHDQIACGIEDTKIQRRLLAEPELTFDKAFELAQASESAQIKIPRNCYLLWKCLRNMSINYTQSSYSLATGVSLWRKAQTRRLLS